MSEAQPEHDSNLAAAAGRGILPARHWQLQVPVVMGILNLTPDSFSDGGQHAEVAQALAHAAALYSQGATVVDVGAQSTRPNAPPVSETEEARRLMPALLAIRRQLPHIPLSIDTQRPRLAEAALQAGAAILNDVSERTQPSMAALARQYGCPLVVMHGNSREHRGERPRVSGQRPGGRALPIASVHEVFRSLAARARRLEQAGLAPHQIWLDPGLGFGKSGATSAALLLAIGALASKRWPTVVGASRKRFLFTGSAHRDPKQADLLTAHASAMAFGAGVRIVRVHAPSQIADGAAFCRRLLAASARVGPARPRLHEGV